MMTIVMMTPIKHMIVTNTNVKNIYQMHAYTTLLNC
jgi:hypothetical protein